MVGIHRGRRPLSPPDRLETRGSHSRENRWLPKLMSQGADSQQPRYGKHGDRSRDRSDARAPRADSLYGPPPPSASSSKARAASSRSPTGAEHKTAAPQPPSTSMVVAQTPTLDEAEDRHNNGGKNAKLVSKSFDKSDNSPVSSPASQPHSPDENRKNFAGDESMESGEQRSENEDGKKDNVKQKYSKFESSPEMNISKHAHFQKDSDTESDMDAENGDGEDKEVDRLKNRLNLDQEISIKEEREVYESESAEITIMEDKLVHLPAYYPATMGCRSVEEFQNMNKIEEGTYGVVYRATEKRTGEIVALKRLKMEKEKEGFPITSLREINMLLKAGKHPNIVKVREIVVGSNMDKIYLVMDYVEHDLKTLMETMSHQNQHFTSGEIKTLMDQLLKGINYLHDNWILHRDLKTSNLLFSHKGILQIGDFGLAREYGSPLKPYTPIVVTLWYRAPELLLGTQQYSTPIDMWSVGCVFAELLSLKPFFTGKSELEQLQKIFKTLGTPNSKIWDGYDDLPGVKKMSFADYPFNSLRKHLGPSVLSENGFNLLNKFLTYDPKKRITATQALQDEFGWLKEEPRPVPPDMFPTWPAKSERTAASALSRLPAVRKAPTPETKGAHGGSKEVESNEELLSGLKIKPSQIKAASGFSLKFGSHL